MMRGPLDQGRRITVQQGLTELPSLRVPFSEQVRQFMLSLGAGEDTRSDAAAGRDASEGEDLDQSLAASGCSRDDAD